MIQTPAAWVKRGKREGHRGACSWKGDMNLRFTGSKSVLATVLGETGPVGQVTGLTCLSSECAAHVTTDVLMTRVRL